MKKKVKLTESQLTNLIKKTVHQIIKEDEEEIDNLDVTSSGPSLTEKTSLEIRVPIVTVYVNYKNYSEIPVRINPTNKGLIYDIHIKTYESDIQLDQDEKREIHEFIERSLKKGDIKMPEEIEFVNLSTSPSMNNISFKERKFKTRPYRSY